VRLLPPIDAAETQLVRLAADLEARRLRVESDLLVCLLSIPREGARIAAACGVTAELFDDDGHALIFRCMLFASDKPLSVIVRLALAALQHYRIPGWNAERICALATAWPGPAPTPALAATLVKIQARQRQSLALMRAAREALAWEGAAA
jgi:hypothetical protein